MAITNEDVLAWLRACAEILAENRDYLVELDAAIGDADHGVNMDRGFKAVVEKLPEVANANISMVFRKVGMTLISTVGGAAGPLYGTFFIQSAMKIAERNELNLAEWADALQAGVDGVVLRGKAELGDKTMLDSLRPAADALKQAAKEERPLDEALGASAEAARQGMEATIPMVARKGRASYLGERSAGHQDPGATSSYLLLQAAADVWGKKN